MSPEEKIRRALERNFRKTIASAFTLSGFTRIASRDIPITIDGRRGDVDAIYAYENVVLLIEDTTSSAGLGDHIRKTHDWFSVAESRKSHLVAALSERIPGFAEYTSERPHYHSVDYRFFFLYASLHPVEERYTKRYGDVLVFLSFAQLQYFASVAAAIERTARFEILKFLGLDLHNLGPSRSASETTTYKALFLPESPSGFPPGHQLVSFLADPATLLERAYVLRADGWQDSEALYQRLLIKKKIAAMRTHLAGQKRVFINNVIVTLPSDTKLRDEDGAPPSGRDIKPITVTIPRRFSTIGIIDGQHRVYAYHEGSDAAEAEIDRLRRKQHLLVTGIVYPPKVQASTAQRFEAGVFLEINDKQTRVKSDLKQSIERLLDPFSSTAVAKAVIERMGHSGPLAGFLEVHFFDSAKIKTASIVGYGLKHIVRIDGEHSLFRIWRAPLKRALRRGDEAALDAYVRHCAGSVNALVAGFRRNLPGDMWTLDQKSSRVLTTTTINGLIFCLRCLLEHGRTGNHEYYAERFKRLTIDFRPKSFPYKSSHWKALGTDIYQQCFD